MAKNSRISFDRFQFLTILVGSFFLILLIGAGGYLFGARQNQPVTTVPQTLPTQTPSPTPDPTANWKTYTFSFFLIKLPPGWLVSEGNPVQLLNYDMKNAPGRGFDQQLDKGRLKVEIYKTDSGDNLRRYLDGIRAERYQKGLGDSIWQESQITVDGLPAVKVKTSNPGFGVYTQSSTSERIISIAFTLDFDNYQQLAHQILSTFRFTQ